MDIYDERSEDSTPPGDSDVGDGLSWEGRVLAVALFWSVGGFVWGAIATLPLSFFRVAPIVPLAVGVAVGFLAGVLLEADYLD